MSTPRPATLTLVAPLEQALDAYPDVVDIEQLGYDLARIDAIGGRVVELSVRHAGDAVVDRDLRDLGELLKHLARDVYRRLFDVELAGITVAMPELPERRR